ncbi:MAG: hypothetical protein PSX37_06415 [bacterium]|nr:hypothetical protein [bacterium]
MFEPVASHEYDAHLAGLNRSFTNWGTSDRLGWVLRPFGGQSHDIFAMREAGGLVAGSIVSYRLIESAGQPELVGVMTGSWTDPQLRGRGVFSAMIEHSADLARDRDAVALLAFVTADNGSRRRLEAAGSTMIPTWYMSAPAPAGDVWHEVLDVDDVLRHVDAARSASRGHHVRFAYPSIADLHGQLVDRSPDTRVITSTAGEIAVVERVQGTLRVLATSDPSCEPWLPGTKDRFSFTADPDAAQMARLGGARVTDGFLTVLSLSHGWHCPQSWLVESGDRI